MPFWRFGKRSDKDEERRPARRVRPSKQSPVEVQIMGSNSLDILHARDISSSGLGVFVPHRFEGCDIDSEVELVITLPRTRTFLARGVIRHFSDRQHSEQYFGLEFTQISERNRDQILDYMRGVAGPGEPS